jgi:putative hydrolase of the HAD superfamily
VGPPPLRAVLFDAVGTLIGLREPVGETYARLARSHGIEISASRIGEAFVQSFERAEPMVFPEAAAAEIEAREREWWRGVVHSAFRAADGAADLSDFDACFERLYRHFAASGAWRPLPGSRELLQGLRDRGLATAVVSNFDRRLAPILEGLGLRSLLDALVLPSDARAAKPDPRIFAVALERLGVSAAAALFVGDDRARDVEAARRAGLRAVDVGGLAKLGDLMECLP